MKSFDDIYKMCIGVIVNDLRKYDLHGEAEEYISEAYLDLINSEKPITFDNLYKRARAKIFKGEEFLVSKRPEFLSNETTKTCFRCKENKPVGIFGITKSKAITRRLIQPYCRDCAKKYFKEYFNKHRREWNDKMKTRYQKERDELHPTYIKKVLRVYGWKTDEINDNVINHIRKKVLSENVKIGSFKKTA